MTVVALLLQLAGFWRTRDYFLAGLDALILVAAVLVALEAFAALRRARRAAAAAQAEA